MAGGAADVTVAAQDLVEHQRLAEVDEHRILGGHRTDRDGAPALQGLPQLGVERRRQRLRRRDPVAGGGEPTIRPSCKAAALPGDRRGTSRLTPMRSSPSENRKWFSTVLPPTGIVSPVAVTTGEAASAQV